MSGNTARTAIVTGGGQGIGRAVAMRFLSDGWRVVLAEGDPEAGQEAEAELKALGKVAFVQTNVSEESEVDRMAGRALELFGRIDALVNNAGIGARSPVTDLSLSDWNRVLGVNLTGPFLCSKRCAPHLRETRGAIVNIASTRALMSEANTEAYSASKGGVVALTHALSVSLGPEIRVNCVSPGWIEVSELKKKSKRKTPSLSEADHSQHPAGRVGKGSDIASLVAFLVSEEAGFITGANFVVDGGMTRKMMYE